MIHENKTGTRRVNHLQKLCFKNLYAYGIFIWYNHTHVTYYGMLSCKTAMATYLWLHATCTAYCQHSPCLKHTFREVDIRNSINVTALFTIGMRHFPHGWLTTHEAV